ncbi:MAG: diaminopimelate dehydrogenase, partial [Anaeroplasmataceae bacterium]|nr:diaminopimelate dehydrogenase [Anaeroplasmataceae bacterium]
MIKIGICGYGNLGKGVEKALLLAKDMELVGIFTRRDPTSLNHPLAYQMEDLKEFENKIDVLILCGGSATDLPIQTPMLAGRFNVVDSFDTHAKIIQHFDNVDQNARLASKTAIISTGWDPGFFSLNRIYMESVLPNGKDYTFWGKGVSQGHSDAIRRIKGVKNAKQYTIPKEEALELVRKGVQPNLSVRDKHLRECFVVLENDANPEVVEKEIKEMPNYFS